jgi:hypothetical protein
MNTYKQVLKNNPDKQIIIKAVINQLGLHPSELSTSDEVKESLIYDIINRGIDGGYRGFIYHTDTVKFYKKYRSEINQWLKEYASEFGEDVVTMVGNFGCIKDQSSETRDEIGICVYGGRMVSIPDFVPNALAWFAAEEVCRLFDN